MAHRTPRGRYLGRKPDRPDPRDRHYAGFRRAEAPHSVPTHVDLRGELPPAYDQGHLSSCGACAGAALMTFLFPGAGPFSRLQIYYDVRLEEGDPSDDSGVETRDVLKVLQQVGAGPESGWPYQVGAFAIPPPRDAEAFARAHRLTSYARLVSEGDHYACLAAGFPFVLGFECYESIDGDDLAMTGVMVTPKASERLVGGHDVLVVGYDQSFRSNREFLASGVDPTLVSDRALLIRNSWGTSWGCGGGHFWMPIDYALNPSTGGDAWCGRAATT